MMDAVAQAFEAFLQEKQIKYIKPDELSHGHERDVGFYLIDFDLAVEVRCGWSERLKEQVVGYKNAWIILGFQGVVAFKKCIEICATSKEL